MKNIAVISTLFAIVQISSSIALGQYARECGSDGSSTKISIAEAKDVELSLIPDEGAKFSQLKIKVGDKTTQIYAGERPTVITSGMLGGASDCLKDGLYCKSVLEKIRGYINQARAQTAGTTAAQNSTLTCALFKVEQFFQAHACMGITVEPNAINGTGILAAIELARASKELSAKKVLAPVSLTQLVQTQAACPTPETWVPFRNKFSSANCKYNKLYPVSPKATTFMVGAYAKMCAESIVAAAQMTDVLFTEHEDKEAPFRKDLLTIIVPETK